MRRPHSPVDLGYGERASREVRMYPIFLSRFPGIRCAWNPWNAGATVQPIDVRIDTFGHLAIKEFRCFFRSCFYDRIPTQSPVIFFSAHSRRVD